MMLWCSAAENREEKSYSCSLRREQRGCRSVTNTAGMCFCNTNLCNRPDGYTPPAPTKPSNGQFQPHCRFSCIFIMDARSAMRPCYVLPMFFIGFIFMAALVGQTAERIFTKLSHVVDISCYLQTY